MAQHWRHVAGQETPAAARRARSRSGRRAGRPLPPSSDRLSPHLGTVEGGVRRSGRAVRRQDRAEDHRSAVPAGVRGVPPDGGRSRRERATDRGTVRRLSARRTGRDDFARSRGDASLRCRQLTAFPRHQARVTSSFSSSPFSCPSCPSCLRPSSSSCPFSPSSPGRRGSGRRPSAPPSPPSSRRGARRASS